MKRRKLKLQRTLATIEQEVESLLNIPTLHTSTITYLNKKRELIQKSRLYLISLIERNIIHSKETALIVLSHRLPAAHESLIYQFIEYRLSIQKRMSAKDCSPESKSTCQQYLDEIECLIDFLLLEAEKAISERNH